MQDAPSSEHMKVSYKVKVCLHASSLIGAAIESAIFNGPEDKFSIISGANNE